MRRFFKWVIILSCTLISLFVLVGMFLPSDSYVQRSVVINKPVSQVYTIISDLRLFPKWQPWNKDEYEVRFSFDNEDNQQAVVNKLYWQSNVPDVTYGNITIEERKENEAVNTRVIVTGNTLFNFNYLLTPLDNDRTEVFWVFEADHGSNIFARYFSLTYQNKVVGYFDRGLENLKNLVEQ